MIVPEAVKPLPKMTFPPKGSNIVGVTTPGAWMLLPILIASNPATPVKFGEFRFALSSSVVCMLVSVNVIAGGDTVPVTFKLPNPFSFAISVVPTYHLNADALLGTLVQIVPGAACDWADTRIQNDRSSC